MKKVTVIELRKEDLERLKALQEKLGLQKVQVIRLAILRLYENEIRKNVQTNPNL